MDFSEMTDSQLSRALSDMSSSLSSLESTLEDLRTAARQKLSQYHPSSSRDKTVKILESFISYLPDDGSKVLCRWISENENGLASMADHLGSAVLLPMRVCGGQTPHLESSPFGRIDDVAQLMGESATRDEQNPLKKFCLQRDQYRCVITGLLDSNSRDHFPELSDDEFEQRLTPTHASHIIPFKLGKFENNAQEVHLASIWTTLFALFPNTRDVIRPELINEPRNVMTVWSALNEEFGALRLALEATEVRHTYKVKPYRHFPRHYANLFPTNEHGEWIVHFTKPAGINTELPSPEIIAMHAAIAQILHASGMAEVVDKTLRDLERLRELPYLAPDGTTDIARHIAILAIG